MKPEIQQLRERQRAILEAQRRLQQQQHSKQDFARLDSDGDSLPNAEEWARGTNPYSLDTDGDGYTDLAEIQAGSHPRQARVEVEEREIND